MPDVTTTVALPPDADPLLRGARKVVAVLRGAGHDAWIVGGAVRDLVMGLAPHEYDVATSAPPAEVERLFRKTIPVGVQFGVVRVRLLGREYEVATLRADVGYTDGRRPDSVRFTDLREDVTRRDFTMNGLVLDPATGEVTDLVGGIEDIRERRIRAIGDPRSRFAEDRLRPLRAVRFAAQTGFEVEAGTALAVAGCAKDVASVSAERVQDELRKLLSSSRPGAGLRLLRDTGILAVVMPGLAATGGEVEVVAGVLDRVAGAPVETMWAGMTWPLGAEGAEAALGSLKHSTRVRRMATGAIRAGLAIAGLPLADVAAEKRILRQEGAGPGLALLEARLAVTGGDAVAAVHARRRLAEWTHDDLFHAKLATGDDALAAGIERGPAIAAALAALEDEQLRGRISTREEALAFLRSRVPASVD
jgi:tRNA nucleotidyltransferase/poly(A) polymerase